MRGAIFAGFVLAALVAGASAQVGAPNTVNNNDAEMQERVQNAASFAVKEIQKRCNCVSHYELDQVASARTQVVAGVNFLMDLVVRRDGKPEVHHVVVYDQFGDLRLTKDEVESAGKQ